MIRKSRAILVLDDGRALSLYAPGLMTILERLLAVIVGLLVLAALILALHLDIGRNAAIPAGGIEQPRR